MENVNFTKKNLKLNTYIANFFLKPIDIEVIFVYQIKTWEVFWALFALIYEDPAYYIKSSEHETKSIKID